MTGNGHLLDEVLKRKMGFDGFVVSDWNAIGQVAGCTNDQCPQAVNAGIDMFMVPRRLAEPSSPTPSPRCEAGEIPMARIDDAVTRILRVKLRAGLFDQQAAVGARASPASRTASWTARWRARPCASRWCCSRTTATCCRSRATAGSWSWARAPTASRTRPAAGR